MARKKPPRPPAKAARRKTADKLTAKEAAFCQEYLVDLNGTHAAIRAGYSKRTADVTAAKVLRRERVQKRLRGLMDKRNERLEVTQDRVVQELAVIAFASKADIMSIDDAGNVYVDPEKLLGPAGKAVNGFVQDMIVSKDGDETVAIRRTRVTMHQKNQALRLLAEHLGMIGRAAAIDPAGSEAHSDGVPLADRLKAYRAEEHIDETPNVVRLPKR